MVLSLLFGRNAKKSGGGKNKIGILELDATLKEDHSYKAKVTQLPIETGATVSDHILLDPEEVTITGFVTDTPVTILGPSLGTVAGSFVGNAINQGLGSAIGGVVGGFLGNAISGSDTSAKRTQDAYRTLMDIRDKKEPVTLVTTLKVYTDMVMTSLDIPVEPTTGQAIRFTASFVKITKVSPQSVQIPDEILSKMVADQASPKKDLGKQVGVEKPLPDQSAANATAQNKIPLGPEAPPKPSFSEIYRELRANEGTGLGTTNFADLRDGL